VELSSAPVQRLKRTIERFAISPDDRWVVYLADNDVDDVFELYSVPIEGGASVKLNGPLVAGGAIDHYSFRISPDGGTVVYVADQETVTVREIYAVPIAGGPAVKLNGPMVTAGDVQAFRFIPNEGAVVFMADAEINGIYELYRATLDGQSTQRLTPGFAQGVGVWPPNELDKAFILTPDGRILIYRANPEFGFELFSLDLSWGVTTKISGPMQPLGHVEAWEVSSNSTGVVYRADQEQDDVFEGYATVVTGGPVTKVNPPLVAGGDVTTIKFGPDGERIIYVADQKVDGVLNRYTVARPGEPPRAINEDITASPSMGAVLLPDSRFRLYVQGDIFATALRRAENMILVEEIPQGAISKFLISPNGRYAVYLADRDTLGVKELYSLDLHATTLGAAAAPP